MCKIEGTEWMSDDPLLAALDHELFRLAPEPYPPAPTRISDSGGPMRGKTQSVQYHPYLPRHESFETVQYSATQPSVHSPEIHAPIPTAPGPAVAPIVAQTQQTIVPLGGFQEQPQQSEIPQAVYANVHPLSIVQPRSNGIWLPNHDFQRLCALAGIQAGGAQLPSVSQTLMQLQDPPQFEQQLQRLSNQNHQVLPNQWSSHFASRSLDEIEKFLDEATVEVPQWKSMYECIYCGNVKETTSSQGASDGRVKIRCKCGGKRGDGQARMHTMWRPVNKELSEIDRKIQLPSCAEPQRSIQLPPDMSASLQPLSSQQFQAASKPEPTKTGSTMSNISIEMAMNTLRHTLTTKPVNGSDAEYSHHSFPRGSGWRVSNTPEHGHFKIEPN